MANRQNTLILKRSGVAGKIPTTLALGEVALNYADVKAYASGTTTNSILQIGWDRVARTGDTMTGPLTATSFTVTGGLQTQFLKANGTTTILTGASGITYDTNSGIISRTKRQETQTANSNASGIATFTYSPPYSATPNVQYNLGVGAVVREVLTPVTSTASGSTFQVQIRVDVLGLLPAYNNVNGREVNILVVEK
jgi:hypothetical protein